MSPEQLAYSILKGDFRLTRLSDSPIDAAIAEAAEAGRLRDSSVDPYVVLHFAKRAAVRALRNESPEWCISALRALGQTDLDEADPRDAAWGLGILWCVLGEVEPDRAALWRSISEQFSDSLQAAMAAQAQRDDVLSDWGYRVIDSAEGPGLMPWDSFPFHSSVDLVRLGLALADTLNEGPYLMDDPTGGGELPSAWFRPVSFPSRRAQMTRAVVTLRGTHRSDPGPAQSQRLLVFVGETTTTADARWLADTAMPEASGRHIAPCVEGRIIALVVAGSFQVGVPSIETRESVGAIAETVARQLRGHGAG